MYITITDIIGEKQVDLSYSIKNFDSSKEVAVVSVFSDNIRHEFKGPCTIDLKLRNKRIKAGSYTTREF